MQQQQQQQQYGAPGAMNMQQGGYNNQTGNQTGVRNQSAYAMLRCFQRLACDVHCVIAATYRLGSIAFLVTFRFVM